MGATTYLRAMAHNSLLANHRLLAACAQLEQAELEAQRTSFFPSLRLTLNHILAVDRYYLDALEGSGRGLAVLDEPPCATFAALAAAQRDADRRLVRFCAALDATRLRAHVVLQRPTGAFTERTERVLLHLFAHQIHHRGQAHAMLAGTTVAPPQLDEFLLASDAPERAADLSALGLEEAALWPD